MSASSFLSLPAPAQKIAAIKAAARAIVTITNTFGTFTYESDQKVEKDDLYDLASLTKTTATLLAVMKLYDEGKFGLTGRAELAPQPGAAALEPALKLPRTTATERQ